MILIFIFLSMIFSSVLIAGDKEIGNGGDVVICSSPFGTSSVELLDFYEAKTPPREIYYNLGKKELLVEEKISIALGRLAVISPDRAQRYQQKAQVFFNNAVFLPGIELVDIPDSLHLARPRRCKIEQIIIQTEPRFPRDKRYTISKDLWDHLDNDNRAGLIIHEIIFNEALGLGHDNSIATRYFNSLITSKEIEAYYSGRKTVELFRMIDFNFVRINGAMLDVSKDIQFFENGNIKSGEAIKGSSLSLRGKDIRIKESISFYDNRSLKEVIFLEPQTLLVKGHGMIKIFRATFYLNGDFKSVQLDTGEIYFIDIVKNTI